MNKEVKEILDKLKTRDDLYHRVVGSCEVPIKYYEAHLLLDYITNLEKENNKLTAESTEWESRCYDLQKENETLKQAVKDTYDSSQDMLSELQTKYDKLKERCEYLQRSCERKEEQRDTARMEYMEQEDYKSRNEKAIESINNHRLSGFKELEYVSYLEFKKELLNILQGEDK